MPCERQGKAGARSRWRWASTQFNSCSISARLTEMALNVLAYNMKRVMAIIGVAVLLEALAA